MRLYDKSTAQNPDEEDDYQYQGKRREQVEYSIASVWYITIAMIVVAIAAVIEHFVSGL